MNITLPSPSPGQSIRAEHIRQLTAAIKRLMPCSSPTVRVQETANGIVFHAQTGGGAADSPVDLSQPWAISSSGVITPGTVSYGTTIMPLMAGIRLDAAPAPTIYDIGHTGSGTEYYYLKLTWNPTFTNGYLSAMTLAQGDVIIERHTVAPSSTNSIKYILLATFVNGTQTAAPVTTSPLPVTLWDNGYLATVLRVGQL